MNLNQMNKQEDQCKYHFLRRRYLKKTLEDYVPQFLHWRKEKHLSLMQVSDGTGIPVKLLQPIEARQRNMPIWAFLKLCRFYKKKIWIRLDDV